MFESLQDKFSETMKKLRGQGTLSEKNIEDALRDVRLSLLEADVHFKVVKEFIADVKARALGREVMAALTPAQEFVRIVSEELTKTMGGAHVALDLKKKPPVIILMMGLQGSGKTTTTGKLALRLKAEKRSPLLVPADIARPAAIKQLQTLAGQVGVDCFDTQAGQAVLDIAKAALNQASI